LDVTEEMSAFEVLSGCIQYKPLLDIIVDAFYVQDGKNFLISERNLYVVICYMATFQIEKFGIQQFCKIIKSQNINKMYQFLRFFFDTINLNTWIKDEWSKIYDVAYVTEKWINPLLRWQPEVEQLLDQLNDTITNSSALKKISKTTEPEEFNLTKPKPRAIPVPEKIPQLEKALLVPQSTYKTPKEQQLLSEMKLKNRHKAEALLIKANIGQFRCANPEKSEGTKYVMAEIVKERNAKMTIRAHKAHPVPVDKSDNIPIRLNIATILREGALYQRTVEKELRKIEGLMGGAWDPDKFLERHKQIREKEMEQQLAELEKRRLEEKLSHEEAVLARQNVIQENKKKVVLKKKETEELMRQYAEQRLQEEKEVRKLIEQVAEGHKNTKQARVKLHEYKQRIVQEVTEESRGLLRQALEQAEEEMRKKFEVIQQIQAIQSVPLIRHKFVDLTQTAGHALLCEMSMLELHERLALLKEAERKEAEEKRDQILNEKQAKEQLLLDKLEQISLHRTELGRAAVLK
uniref:Cilia and flagella associated protein 99 n=2 Tax=Latimeria chalumnae TaxID=7897 RepID=H3AMX2_LATCH